MKWTLFLDRDGVINKDLGYVHTFKDFEYLPGCIDALRKLSESDIDIFIITNQSGIARGLFTESEFNNLMHKVHSDLLNNNILIKKTFYCPHYLEGVIKKYAVKCNCRKPKPGLINKAVDEFKIDLKKSIFIGDKITDMSAADAAGVKYKILLKKYYADDRKENFVSYDNWNKVIDYIKKDIF